MKQKKFSSFLIIQYNRQYTPTEIIQTAFIFCIFNIMLEFLKPLPLIFRNIYLHFAEFSTWSFDDLTVARDVFTKKDGDRDLFSKLTSFIVDKYIR